MTPIDNGTAQPNLSPANLRLYEISLPPFTEQRRIVQKVDELMALCDRLQASLTTTDNTRSRLLESLLAEALGDRLAQQRGQHPVELSPLAPLSAPARG
jgi:Type I restriction modification DNA specificity domain